VIITDESLGVTQLLGARAQAPPKVYAYVVTLALHITIIVFIIIFYIILKLLFST